MDKTAVEDFADLAGRARADLKVLENRRDASQERMESNGRINSISGNREYNIALGKVRALNSAITNMKYFVKALEEAHARETCRVADAMPAEKKYGQPCKCGDDLCGYWYCKCPLRSNVSKDNYCGTCYLHNPHLREEEGKWCEATRKWTCKCYVGKNWACCGHVFHHTTVNKYNTTTNKCDMCNMVNPCPAPKPKEVTKYGEWCEHSKCRGSWLCYCENNNFSKGSRKGSRSHRSGDLSVCPTCNTRRPDPEPVAEAVKYGEWCEATRKWKCKCAAGNDWACCGHIYHLSLFTSKCTGCGTIRPPMDLLAEEIKYGKWCVCGCGEWKCGCIRHGGRVRRYEDVNKCTPCGHHRPKRAYK